MNFKKTPIIILFVSLSAFAQEKNKDILVRIEDKVITVEEFKHRYEFTPQINRKYSDQNNAKEEFLYTLIAEKLFALEAEKKGFDTLKIMQNTFTPLKQMYIRDALYKKEIKDSVKLNYTMFNEGMNFASYKLFVDYLYTKDEGKIHRAYNKLIAIQNFDSLAPLFEGIEYVKEPYEVTYGKMFPATEKDIYNLQIGEITKPQQSPDGWYIFRLISKIPVIYQNAQEKISKVKNVVENRIEDSIYNNFWRKFFKEKLVNTNGALFWYFTDNVQKIIADTKEKLKIQDDEKIPLTSEGFVYLRNNLTPDSLKREFIKFKQNPVTLEQFINDFEFEGFYTFTTDPKIIASQLKSRVKRQIELEMLTRFANEKGYYNLPEVKSSTNIWYDNYLSTIYKKDFLNNTKLTEKDILDYLKENNKITGTKYKIIEVLTDSLEVVQEALKIADNDSLFKEFAKKHSKRESVKNNLGEFDYFNVTEYEEIGKIVESMDIGDVYGPLQTHDGYSVFKLIDKKDNNLASADSTLNEKIKKEIRYKKVINGLENKTVELAAKYKIQINENTLDSLQLLNTQMIVFRYMGFGGRILAFPYSTPFYKWKEKWEQKKKDVL